MKYNKTVYSDQNTCSSDLTFDEYYNNDNNNSNKFNINASDYNCEECDNVSKALTNVRSNCGSVKRSSCTGNNICASDSNNECVKIGCSCTTNCIGYDSKEAFATKWKKIQKTVGVSSSEYAMNKSSLMVLKIKPSAIRYSA